MPYQAGTSAQRIRIGLTGLAVAFLVVLLASVVSRAGRDDVSNAAQQANEGQPSEPLAELGVAPGASDSDNGAANAVTGKPGSANSPAGSARTKK